MVYQIVMLQISALKKDLAYSLSVLFNKLLSSPFSPFKKNFKSPSKSSVPSPRVVYSEKSD